MKIAISGCHGFGAREHALAELIFRHHPDVDLYCYPGNPGTYPIATNVPVQSVEEVIDDCAMKRVDFIIPGPEGDLVAGLADLARDRHLKVFGPTKQAAQLESDKHFAKNVMASAKIASAPFKFFPAETSLETIIQSCALENFPLVVKANGLASGKGVRIVNDLAEARAFLQEIHDNGFGKEGVLIEEVLKGEEGSLFYLINSQEKVVVPLKGAQDYKKIYEGDLGANTGGMGAYSDAPVLSEEVIQKVTKNIVHPLIKELERRHIHYTGVLYVGLMIDQGEPSVVEFNCRFGDPEAQVVLPRMKSSILETFIQVYEGKTPAELQWDLQQYVCIVLASKGYPEGYQQGFEIFGIQDVPRDFLLFHAGTKTEKGRLLTNGGRVLSLVASAETIKGAREKLYEFLNKGTLHFSDMYYRSDISMKADKWLTIGT